MSNQLQRADINQIQAIGEWDTMELSTLKETIAKDLSVPQFNLFMYQANAMGLNPFLKHVFPILYGGKLDIRVAYEGLLSLAKKSEGFLGVYNQVICEQESDDFEAETDDDGVITKIKHKVRFPRGKVIGAYSIAKREGKKDFIVLMDLNEVQKYLKGQNQKFWKMEDGSPDPDMFKKHVGFRAIKGQYDIASVVEENIEEMNGVAAVPEYKPGERKDITHEANAAAASSASNTQSSKQPQQQTQTASDEEQIANLRTQIKSNFRKLGITDSDGRQLFYESNGVTFSTPETVAELEALVRKQELRISEKQAAADDELN